MKYMLVLVLSIILMPAAWSQSNPPINKEDAFALIINSLDSCYSNTTLSGTTLAECVLGKLKTHVNPDQYQVNFYQESFDRNVAGVISLTIYNKFGQVFMCSGVSQQTIKIERCWAKKVKALTPADKISIIPPD